MTLVETAHALLADGKGILAADESIRTMTKRLEALGIDSTSASRRDYREMPFTTPGLSSFISGLILYMKDLLEREARRNEAHDRVISDQRSRVGVRVIPTDEELTIARQTAAAIASAVGVEAAHKKLQDYLVTETK
jgi:fructose-bisphosphate aldolase class I